MHFQQFEDLELLFFPRKHAPGPPKSPCRVSNRPSRIRRDCPDFTRESRILTRLLSGNEYPNFEEQLSQANEQRNMFLLNYHKICHKINKLLNLDIQANAELQSWWITQEVQNKITWQDWPVRLERFLDFQHFQIKHFAAKSPIHLHHNAVRH